MTVNRIFRTGKFVMARDSTQSIRVKVSTNHSFDQIQFRPITVAKLKNIIHVFRKRH